MVFGSRWGVGGLTNWSLDLCAVTVTFIRSAAGFSLAPRVTPLLIQTAVPGLCVARPHHGPFQRGFLSFFIC